MNWSLHFLTKFRNFSVPFEWSCHFRAIPWKYMQKMSHFLSDAYKYTNVQVDIPTSAVFVSSIYLPVSKVLVSYLSFVVQSLETWCLISTHVPKHDKVLKVPMHALLSWTVIVTSIALLMFSYYEMARRLRQQERSGLNLGAWLRLTHSIKLNCAKLK